MPFTKGLKLPKLTFGIPLALIMLLLVLVGAAFAYSYYQNGELKKELARMNELEEQLNLARTELDELRARDEYKINQDLTREISDINKTYTEAISAYEAIDDYEALDGDNVDEFKEEFASILKYLSDRNYASAEASLASLSSEVEKERTALVAAATATISTANLPQSNTPPGAGYSRQSVSALGSNYVVDIVAADLGSTRVIVDTASDGDCGNECPVLSLGDYVGRNGAFAGINGSYFCPASYPSCAGKTNTFDTLLMNKNKVYFNSENNVYSNVPAVIFLSGGIRFVGASSEWGRDTGIDSMIANQPLLVSGGGAVFGGDGDPKKGSRGTRSFVGSKGNTVYIGVTHNVTVAEMSQVLATMGLEYALNLDSGGSTALWANGGYRAGPGRNIPNAILFVGR